MKISALLLLHHGESYSENARRLHVAFFKQRAFLNPREAESFATVCRKDVRLEREREDVVFSSFSSLLMNIGFIIAALNIHGEYFEW